MAVIIPVRGVECIRKSAETALDRGAHSCTERIYCAAQNPRQPPEKARVLPIFGAKRQRRWAILLSFPAASHRAKADRGAHRPCLQPFLLRD